MVLPLMKLGTLALRTLCKPIANRLKKQASLHPRFRRLIINFAQANHRITTNMQRRIYGHATNVEIRPLNEEKAVQAAADLLGELFIFSEMKQRDDKLEMEIELLKHKVDELEQLARSRGLAGVFSFKHSRTKEDSQPSAAASST